jgi:hypothetical protein
MARGLNWQKRAFDFKSKRAFKDEEEFHKSDRAARFIAHAEQNLAAGRQRQERSKTAAEPKRQADADQQRARASTNCSGREKPPQPAKPTRQQHHKPKSGKGETIVIPGDGDPCPRCGVPEIHEHNGIGDEQLRKPFYYKRWFRCTNKSCKTTLVMSERYKVFNSSVRSDPGSDNMIVQPDPADPNERPPWE